MAWHFPLIEFSPGRQLPQLADQLAALGESDLLFALSQHAVAFAQSQLHQQDRKWPRQPDYFAIGRTTALALHTVSGQKILYPQDREISEVLLQLRELQNIAGKRALILRGNGGRELIGDTQMCIRDRFLSSAWGCRLSAPEHNIYQKQGKGVVYLRPYEKTNLSLYRDIIIPLTDESCRNAAAEVQTLKP